jgi:hypothetical protein
LFVTTDPNSHVFQTDTVTARRLTEDELRTLDPDTMDVGSHAVTHRPLCELAEHEIRQELQQSKGELERILSREVNYFAVPGNWFDRRVMGIAREVGYRAVWCSKPGAVRVGMKPFGLPRINVEGQLTLAQFAAAIRPWGIAQRRMASAFKRAPGRLLGPRHWMPIRNVMMRCIPGGHLSNRRVIVAGGALTVLALLLAMVLSFLA